MPIIKSTVREAKVEHVCDFCGCKIAKGEKYEFQTHVFEGRPYTWKAHIHCQSLCDTLWDYIDPDEPGMTSDNFLEGVQDAMAAFYCPYHCEKYVRDMHGCDDFDENTCIRKFANFMEHHRLYLGQDHHGIMCWRLQFAPAEPDRRLFKEVKG